MRTRRPIDATAAGLMALLCAIWGLQQVSLKLTAAQVAPLTMIALRSGVAALLVALAMRARGERIVVTTGRWRDGIAVGALFALEYLLLGEALRHTQASHATVFLYTAPVFAALGLQWRVPSERLSAAQWAGVALAFGGIALTFWGRGAAAAGGVPGASLWGDFLALLAGAAWGATTVMIRVSALATAPATETLLYQLVVGCLVLGAASLATGVHALAITPALVGHFAFQALVVSFASFLCWFWLLRRYLASQLGVLSFMTPPMGVGFAIWLLREPMDARFVLGGALVVAGVLIVSGYGWWHQGAAARAAAGGTR
jgi:drug/metabolite transporter (DMT)-like permease